MAVELWQPTIPDHNPEISQTESQGGVARRLWGEKFLAKAELINRHSELLFTGIGGGVALGVDGTPSPLRHGDGTQVPYYVDLEEKFGRVPKVLFLTASVMFADHLVGLLSVAQEYKDQGVATIIPVLTACSHERQDHKWRNPDGSRILQPVTVDTVTKMLLATPADQGGPLCDGALVLGLHSLRPVIAAAQFDFPLLPVDPYNFMVGGAGLRLKENLVVLSPDKGRKNDGIRLAHELNVPYGACEKVRARETNGDATVALKDSRLLEYIRQMRSTVVYFDDEIREATTMAGGRIAVAGAAENLLIVAFKGIFARLRGRQTTAAELLVKRLPDQHRFEHEEIIISDAVQPVESIKPIKNKLTVLPLFEAIQKLVSYIQQNPIPLNANWLRESSAGLLELNLVKEEYD